MKNILIVNRNTTNCGVHQYGLNIYETLTKSKNHNYFYLESNNVQTIEGYLINNKIDIIVFNYIKWVMGWITDELINRLSSKYDCYFIYHDGDLKFSRIKGVLYNDPTKIVNNVSEYNINRCLFDFKSNKNNKTNDRVIISSFGFGFPDKGFHNLINKVNDEYSNALIRLHIPNANVDSNNHLKNRTLSLCNNVLGNKNELIITDHFMDNNKLLEWLSESSINCFFYDKKNSNGISSVIDYALSVDVPIAVTNSDMMRHIFCNEICIENNKINDIINRGCNPILDKKIKWSNENFIKNFDLIMN
jgi:hypothetical protein